MSDILDFVNLLEEALDEFFPKHRHKEKFKSLRAALQPKQVDVKKLTARYEELMERYRGGIDYYPNNYAAQICSMELVLEEQGHLTAQPVPDGLVLVPSEYIDAMEELIEVAQLRGDQELPHPADEEKLWTARMQDAWSDAIYQVENLRTPPKQEGE